MRTAYDVRWHNAATGADTALVAHIRAVARPPDDSVVGIGRLCPQCGSSGHGRPWLRVDGRDHHVSVSRSGPHLVTVVAREHVGVDVESVAAVAARWDPALVLAPGESAGTDEERARTWARKEAVLKRRGTGLATPMTDVALAAEAWHDLSAPEGYVAAISPAAPGAGAP